MCFNIPKWKDIGASKVVIDWISNGVPIIFDSEPQPFYRENHSLTVEQYDFVDKKVAELLLAGAIEQLDYQPYCVSPLGTAPKKGEIKYRLIHDLVELNDHCFSSSFSYEDIRSVRKCIHKRPAGDLGSEKRFPSYPYSGWLQRLFWIRLERYILSLECVTFWLV